MIRNLSFLTRIFPFLGANLTSTPKRNVRAEPVLPQNPNRCMSCLVAEKGTPGGRYVPSSDSILFDTDTCGRCGEVNDVCDPSLIEAYQGAGMQISQLSSLPFYKHPTDKLVRLRYRRDMSKTDRRYVVEQFTLEEALERSQAVINWQRMMRRKSRPWPKGNLGCRKRKAGLRTLTLRALKIRGNAYDIQAVDLRRSK